MKSVTIHNLEPALDSLIHKQAREHGTSLNQTIKNLLKKALNLEETSSRDRAENFRDLCGVWTAREEQVFYKATAIFEKIDEEAWK